MQRPTDGQIMLLSDALNNTLDNNGKQVKFTEDKDGMYIGKSTDNFNYVLTVDKPKVTFSVLKNNYQERKAEIEANSVAGRAYIPPQVLEEEKAKEEEKTKKEETKAKKAAEEVAKYAPDEKTKKEAKQVLKY